MHNSIISKCAQYLVSQSVIGDSKDKVVYARPIYEAKLSRPCLVL